MPQRKFTINRRLGATENKNDHGLWTVVELASGKTLSRCVRTMDELAHLFEPAPRRHSKTVKEQ